MSAGCALQLYSLFSPRGTLARVAVFHCVAFLSNRPLRNMVDLFTARTSVRYSKDTTPLALWLGRDTLLSKVLSSTRGQQL